MLRRTSCPRALLWLLAGAGALVVLPAAAEPPTLRWQADLRGDVRVFGNTLAHDCHGVAPVTGTASCTGQLNTDDTAPDLYWLDDKANSSVLPSEARTSATLSLPSGAKVVYARLYWAAVKVGNTPDSEVTLDWKGAPAVETIKADSTFVIPHPYINAEHDWYIYQSSGDATDYVNHWGQGDFRVTGVDAIDLVGADKAGLQIDVTFAAWSLVVFYENQSDDLRNLALFDGLYHVNPPAQGTLDQTSVPLSGFLVPPGFNAKMAAIVYEGDHEYNGDSFSMNGIQVTNGQNPADNFFNSSRTMLGDPASGSWDVPELTGAADSMSGYDLDMIDVTSAVKAGDQQATVSASSTYDKFVLGAFITSITNLAPDFGNFTKTAKDLNGGAVLAGDIIEYTIEGKNTGNDDAINAFVTDKLDAGLELVPGKLEIVTGGATGLKTDVAGDDEAFYDATSRNITWYVGTGATATTGGTVPVGATVKVRFQAKVKATQGTIPNKAILTAAGSSGGPEKTFESDSDPDAVGKQSTDITVKECDSNADCPSDKPHCDTATGVCTGCVEDTDCKAPTTPACKKSTGKCVECTSTNDTLCIADKPVCNTQIDKCVACTLGDNAAECTKDPDGPDCVSNNNVLFCGCDKDSDCGGPTSARVCDDKVKKCIDGCRGEGGNGCMTEKVCTSKDTSIGKCVVPGVDAGPEEDAGTGPAPTTGGSRDEGGCACSTPSSNGLDMAGLALAVLGIGSAVARRRRRSN